MRYINIQAVLGAVWPKLSIIMLLAAHWALSDTAWAGQTTNSTISTSCVAQSGTLGTTNYITDFDNGTFGTENGQPDQSPSVDPYPLTVTGGIFDNFYSIGHGDYAYIANPVTARNQFQHPEVTDPIYGVTGRFFASDPNTNTPTLNFTITNVIPDENYEISFWAANSEFNAVPNKVNAVVDGIVSYSTGDLISNSSALPWQRYAFVFNAGSRNVISLSMESTETGAGGRDFYVDNVEMRDCTVSGGAISGQIYTDSNLNNSYDTGTDGTLAAVDVQLWDDQGTGTTADDIFISLAEANGNGLYEFQNIAPGTNYVLKVDTADGDIPASATIGTATTLPVSVTSGGSSIGHDFGFDVTDAFLEASKVVSLASGGSGYATPGSDVIYTITVINRGTGAADNDSLFIVDTMPDSLAFYNDDPIGGSGDPVLFSQNSANLNFSYSRDIGYAQAGPAPANFAACNYTPMGIYDASVAYICFAPNGAMAGGTPDPSFSISFRAGIP